VRAFIQYLVAGVATGCTFALIATGFVAIHRVTRVVNFAQGTFAVVSGLTAYSLLQHGVPHPLAEVAAVAVSAGLGLLIGVVAIGRPGTPPLTSLVITLGLGILAYAVELVVWGDQPVSFDGVKGSWTVGGVFLQRQYALIIGVSLLTLLLLALFFSRTYLGKGLTACASNPWAARLLGINPTRMGFLAFGLGGALGGIAGVLLAPLQPMTFDADVGIAVSGFAAAIFGGLTRLSWALWGGLVLGIGEALVAGYYQPSYQTGIALAVILILLSWRAVRSGVEEAAGAQPSAGRREADFGRRLRVGALVAAAAVTLLIPQFLNRAGISIFVLVALATLITTGLTLLMGFAGQVSLGQGAFYAIGAYTAGLLTVKAGLPPVVALLAAPVVAAGIAAVIGAPLLRLRGHYLAFATLAFQLIVLVWLAEAKGLTRGDIGLGGIPSLLPTFSDALDLDTPIGYAYLAWAAAVVGLLLARNLIASRPGRALRALAGSELAAAASGVPVSRYKLQVFAMAAAYAGFAGGLYAFFLTFISPASFSILISVQFVVMAVVGGMGAIWGAPIGAVGISLLIEFLRGAATRPGSNPHAPAVLSYGAYAVVLIAVVLFLPGGVFPAFRSALARRFARRDRRRPRESTAEETGQLTQK
jgi:ABC-type branched-subunit amino acid transport system permease subunit